jgi:hypothetical protein
MTSDKDNAPLPADDWLEHYCNHEWLAGQLHEPIDLPQPPVRKDEPK